MVSRLANPSRGRVLVYHQAQAARFGPQLREISKRFDFVDISSAVARLRADLTGDPGRAFALVTFDDGHRDFLAVMDELVRLEVPACLYITSEWLSRPDYLRPSEVKSISETFDIGSHSISHPRLLGLDSNLLARELEGSRHYLEDLIGKPVVHFAAPFGGPASFDMAAVRGAAEAGYETFRTMFRGWNRSSARDLGGLRLLRADAIEDNHPSWRIRATLAGALDWRAGYQLHHALAG